MTEKIRLLEKVSRQLEEDTKERSEITGLTIQFAESFIKDIGQEKAFRHNQPSNRDWLAFRADENPKDPKDIFNFLEKELLKPGLNPASGGHLGYIPGGGVYMAALGDYLAAVTNRYATVYYASPGAVRMENRLIRWMCDMAGYAQNSSGYLSSGGSMANLSAIVAARDALKITPETIAKSVVYYTLQAHHCIDKALRISGLSTVIRRIIPMNEKFQMNTEALGKAIEGDLGEGLLPRMVIASAGTTDTGAVDPIADIADIAEKYKLWYHVDAAYGGFFMLTATGKRLLKDIHRADSIVMDPHKGLFLPYGSGALLIKNRENLLRSFHYYANYMQDAIDPEDEVSPAEISPELSRHFRGLRLWFPLQLYGLKPFRAALEEKVLLTQYFYQEVRKLHFETGPEPELSVMIFRYVPKEAIHNPEAANAFNQSLLKTIQDDGRIFISSTTILDVFWLRIAVLSFRTHLEHIELLLKILKQHTAHN